MLFVDAAIPTTVFFTDTQTKLFSLLSIILQLILLEQKRVWVEVRRVAALIGGDGALTSKRSELNEILKRN